MVEVESAVQRIGQRLARRDLRAPAGRYLRASSVVQRKNGWHWAEEPGEPTPTNLRHSVAGAHWEADEVREDLRA